MSEAIVPLLELAGVAFCSSEIGMLIVAVLVSDKLLTEDLLLTETLGGSISRIGWLSWNNDKGGGEGGGEAGGKAGGKAGGEGVREMCGSGL